MLTDETNSRIELGRQVGNRGGEGVVYEIVGRTGFVAKKYHSPPDSTRIDKLRAQFVMGDEQIRRIAAWPSMLLKENGKPVGFVMPKAEGKPVHLLYRPVDRKQHYPKITWQDLVAVARNVAAAFHVIHSRGILMADVNESNLLITGSGEVRMIDCDSFQITSKTGRVYPCEVGVGFWTPPELQGKTFSTIAREVSHDAFGLANLLFHILFMGKHPFAGVPTLPQLLENPPSVENCIKRFQFAYTRRGKVESSPPPFSLALANLPPPLADLFEQAFLTDRRPTAAVWHQELGRIEFQKCQWGHTFYRKLSECPWCAIWNSGGPNFFVASSFIDTSGSNIADIEAFLREVDTVSLEELENDKNEIEAFAFPAYAMTPFESLSVPINLVKASPLCVSPERFQFFAGPILMGCGLLLPLLAPKFFVLSIVSFVWGLWWMLGGRTNPQYQAEIERRGCKAIAIFAKLKEKYSLIEKEYVKARRDFEGVKRERVEKVAKLQKEALSHFKTEKAGLKAALVRLLNDYRSLPTLRSEMRKQRHESKQLEEFLRKHRINGMRIPQIGPARLSILSQYGVATAWDVKNMKFIPGLGVGDASLRSWLRGIESRFRFNPSLKLSDLAEQEVQRDTLLLEKAILGRYAVVRKSWSELLEQAAPSRLRQKRAVVVEKQLALLQKKILDFDTAQARWKGELQHLLECYGQAKADFDVCPK